MENMKLIKLGKALIMISLAIWIIENFYFGWNKLPMSEAEETCDTIVKIFMYAGLWVYSLPIFSLYEDAVKKHEASKNL
jgi:hypothetical protein